MSFAVYKASAGSGKTFSLVREYLKIVLSEPADFRHILAITFTNKVANEMKERVLSTLSRLARGDGGPPDAMSASLQQDTGYPPEVLAIRAGEALELILHHYSDFSVGTIDSFSHRIIRTFAHDFGLPVNFNVEMDTDALLEKAVDLLLDRIGNDEHLTGLLVNFTETRIDEETDWRIDRQLARFAKNLLDESGQERLAGIRRIPLEEFRTISTQVHASVSAIRRKLEVPGKEALDLLRDAGISFNAFHYTRSGLPSFFTSLAAGQAKEPGARARATLEEDKWTGSKCTPEEKAALEPLKDRLRDLAEQGIRIIEAEGSRLALFDLLKKTIHALAVLNEIARILDEFKRQNNLVHIAEFNSRIARIIMGEPVPYIYERLGERYRHILIDEFQDTSSTQWHNFLPLVENALASGHFNLVVGDGKQAIYRFRNGDAEQFTALPGIPGSGNDPLLLQRQHALTRNYKEVLLPTNFRSARGIVEFNNRFFRILTDTLFPDDNAVYKDLEQIPAPGKEGGFISIESFDGKGSDNLLPDRVLEIVHEAVQDGYSKRDLAVLCRSNVHASEVARHLLLNGIDVVSSESLLVGNSPHVRFLVAFMRFLHGLPDPLVQAEMAGYLSAQGFTARPLHELLVTVSSGITGGAGILQLFSESGLEIRCDELAGLPVYDLTETLIRIFRMNADPDPYLQFFLDAILRFSSSSPAGARDFLDWWELNRGKTSVLAPEQSDAVRVMTIHKAKGLQFPVVIYAFASEIKRNTKDYLWLDLQGQEVKGLPVAIVRTEKGLLDTDYADLYRTEDRKSLLDLVNLLYVVMTRPEERLYILTGRLEATGELRSVPGFIAFGLNGMGLFEEGRTRYAIGTPACRKRRPEHETAALSLGAMISADWRKKIRVRFRAPEMWDMEHAVQSSRWGSRIHTILSGIITRDDLPEALDKAVFSGLIRSSEREQAENEIRPLFAHPLLSKLFRPEASVRTEAELLLPGGLFYRPDRVVMDGEEVYVVDYKTGKQNERHRTQLNQYAGILEEMGHAKVHRILVYLEPKLNVIRY